MINNKGITGGNTLIVGASCSIGLRLIEAFLKTSENVYATYNATPISTDHPGLTSLKLDLLDPTSREQICALFKNKNIKLDVVIMASGIIKGQPLETYTDLEMHEVVSVNFLGQAQFIKCIIPQISQDGQLLFISSIAAERGSFDPIYAASKGAIIPFSKSIAKAYGTQFSTITLLPGAIEGSKMFDDMSEETQARHINQSPRSELLNSTDLAEICFDLTRSHWRHANGSVIRVNGGAYV